MTPREEREAQLQKQAELTYKSEANRQAHLTDWDGGRLVKYVKRRLQPQKKEPAILDLSLTYKWYDMIASGHKKEEYREIKPFYKHRLLQCDYGHTRLCVPYSCNTDCTIIQFRNYDYVRFHRGQGGKETMLVRCEGINIGKGKPEWGAHPVDDVFIIKLGEIVIK